jgi:hypothetical protein
MGRGFCSIGLFVHVVHGVGKQCCGHRGEVIGEWAKK